MHHFQTFTHDSDNEEQDGLNAINGQRTINASTPYILNRTSVLEAPPLYDSNQALPSYQQTFQPYNLFDLNY